MKIEQQQFEITSDFVKDSRIPSFSRYLRNSSRLASMEELGFDILSFLDVFQISQSALTKRGEMKTRVTAGFTSLHFQELYNNLFKF